MKPATPPSRRPRRLLGVAAVAGLVALAASLASTGEPGDASLPTLPSPTTPDDGAPSAATIARRRARALRRLAQRADRAEGPRRAVEARVSTCRGAPAAGADVVFMDADGVPVDRQVAGSDGVVTGAVPARGAFVVWAGLDGFEGASDPSEDARVSVSVCPGAEVMGRVVDERGAPVADATVTLGSGEDVAVTDAGGAFLLTDLDLTGDRVTAQATAGHTSVTLAPLEPWEARELTLVLSAGRTITGWVVSWDGEPAPYADIVAHDFGNAVAARARSDSQGRFWLKGAPTGALSLTATTGSMGVGRTQIRDAVEQDVVITLEPAGRLVLDAPAADGALAVYADDAGRAVGWLRHGESVVLPALTTYSVVWPEGTGTELCGSAFLAPGGEVVIRCGERGEAAVAGRAVDSEGRPLADIDVFARTSGGAYASGTTGPDGRFVLAMELDTTQQGVVSFARTEELAPASRRNLQLVPGDTLDLGDVRLDRYEELADRFQPGPFGGIGAQIDETADGIRLARVVADGPIHRAGLEAGDVIVGIEDDAAGFLPARDAVRLLRGEAGSTVRLRVRKSGGGLVEVVLERSVIDVDAHGWVN